MSDEPLFQLTFNAAHARVMIDALDLFSRVHAGQLDAVYSALVWSRRGADWEGAREALDQAKRAFFPELPVGASHFTGEPCLRAEQVQQVIRHGLAWTQSPEGGMTVDFHEPLNRAGGWMPVMLAFEGDEAKRIRDRANKEIRLIGKLSAVTGTDDVEEAVTRIRAWKEAAERVESESTSGSQVAKPDPAGDMEEKQ